MIGNTISGSAGEGIYLSNISNTEVSKNTITGDGYCMKINGCTTTRVTENTCIGGTGIVSKNNDASVFIDQPTLRSKNAGSRVAVGTLLAAVVVGAVFAI